MSNVNIVKGCKPKEIKMLKSSMRWIPISWVLSSNINSYLHSLDSNEVFKELMLVYKYLPDIFCKKNRKRTLCGLIFLQFIKALPTTDLLMLQVMAHMKILYCAFRNIPNPLHRQTLTVHGYPLYAQLELVAGKQFLWGDSCT